MWWWIFLFFSFLFFSRRGCYYIINNSSKIQYMQVSDKGLCSIWWSGHTAHCDLLINIGGPARELGSASQNWKGIIASSRINYWNYECQGWLLTALWKVDTGSVGWIPEQICRIWTQPCTLPAMYIWLVLSSLTSCLYQSADQTTVLPESAEACEPDRRADSGNTCKRR
jgi:hypothetical protein